MQQLGKLPYNRSSPEMKTTLKMWQKFLFFFLGNKLKKTVSGSFVSYFPNNVVKQQAVDVVGHYLHL